MSKKRFRDNVWDMFNNILKDNYKNFYSKYLDEQSALLKILEKQN